MRIRRNRLPRFGAIVTLIALATLVIAPSAVGSSPTGAAPLAPVEVNHRFGMVWINCERADSDSPGFSNCGLSNSSLDSRIDAAKEAGVGLNRWALYWNETQPSSNSDPNTWSWEYADSIINRDVASGIETIPILTGTAEQYATSGSVAVVPPRIGGGLFPGAASIEGAGSSTAASVPAGLEEPVFVDGAINPANPWGWFVYSVVHRYKDRVQAWEIWNEPDFDPFWSGSNAEYVRLLKVGYLAAKAADPTTTVLFGGMAYWEDQGFLPEVLDLIVSDPDAAANGYFFDVLPIHLYANPYHIKNLAPWAKGQMTERGIMGKPIWVNETNVALCARYGCPSTYRASETEQASFVIQAMALSFVSNVDRLFTFQLYDDGNTEDFGFRDNEGHYRPSYIAFQVGSRYLRSPSAVVQGSVGQIERIVLDGTPLGRVTVVWNNGTTETATGIRASAASALLVDQEGNQSIMIAVDGFYVLVLPGKTNQYAGGAEGEVPGRPFLIIEDVPPNGCLNFTGGIAAAPAPQAFITHAPLVFRQCNTNLLGAGG